MQTPHRQHRRRAACSLRTTALHKCAVVPSRAGILGSWTLKSLNLRIYDLPGPITGVKKKQKKSLPPARVRASADFIPLLLNLLLILL